MKNQSLDVSRAREEMGLPPVVSPCVTAAPTAPEVKRRLTWRQWGIRILATLFVLIGVLFALILDGLNRLGDDMCATTIFDRSASPNGKVQAVLYGIDCGATTGFNRHVSIAPLDVDLTKKNPEFEKSFFGAQGEPRVTMTWLSSGRLEVQYPEGTNIFRNEPKSEGIAIEYKKSR
jgi:hypothetical protein